MEWNQLTALLEALSGFAWPVVALVIVFAFRSDISNVTKRLRKGKLLGQELELDAQVDRLDQAAKGAQAEAEAEVAREVATQAAPRGDAPKRDESLSDPQVANVLELAAQVPSLALIRLGTLLEAALREVASSTGLVNPTAPLGPQALLRRLEKMGRLPPQTGHSLDVFWDVRNTIVHGRAPVDDHEVLRVLDIGLSLLRIVRAIPHETFRVREADVPLYEDPAGRRDRSDVVGVVLDVTSPGGTQREVRVFPTTRRGHYSVGMRVAWDFDIKRVWDASWYRHPESGSLELAWNSAAEFTGEPIVEPLSGSTGG